MSRRCQEAAAPAAPQGKADRAKGGSVMGAVPWCPNEKSQTDLVMVINSARARCEYSS